MEGGWGGGKHLRKRQHGQAGITARGEPGMLAHVRACVRTCVSERLSACSLSSALAQTSVNKTGWT